MRWSNCLLLGSCLLFIIATGTSLSQDSTVTVNLMINADIPSGPTNEQMQAAQSNLQNIYKEIKFRNNTATIFLTEEVSTGARLQLAQIPLFSNIEFAISGKDSDEKLTDMSYSEQIATLKSSKKSAEATNICGLNTIEVKGFMPPSFDQNEETYKAIDELGILYDAGFQAGSLYANGHENDVWPYQIENHSFFAVPISTYDLSGKKVLYDGYAKENGLNSSQWYDILAGKFNEAKEKDEPVVIMISLSNSGQGEYLESLKKFLNFASSNNAIFVSTSELVEMARIGVHKPASVAGSKKECKTCSQEQGGLKTSISVIPTNASASNSSAYNTSLPSVKL